MIERELTVTTSEGELPTFVLAVVVAVMWSRDDTKVTKRLDRKADRNEDAELIAYNANLARIAQRDAQTPSN